MLLTLCLLRHGRAAGQSPEAELLPAGEAQIRALGRLLAAEGFAPEAAFTSPYHRAQRTARLLLDELRSTLEARALPELVPDADPGVALRALFGSGLPLARVLVVSHQPLLGRMAIALTEQDPGFSAGTLAEIELAEGEDSGTLVRRLGPEDLAG
jgi:phosphohistidine phosphatase